MRYAVPMPTLYVENVPDELYEALRERARARRTSMAAEVLELLSANVSTAGEPARRQAVMDRAKKMRAKKPAGGGPFPSSEPMQRQDRARTARTQGLLRGRRRHSL